jgi:hypothetical protein
MPQDYSPHSVSAHAHPHSASVVQVESSKLMPMLVITAMLAALAIGLSVLAVVLSQISEREARLAQYDLQILRAKVEAAGIHANDH